MPVYSHHLTTHNPNYYIHPPPHFPIRNKHHPSLSSCRVVSCRIVSSPRSFHHHGPSTPASNPSSTFVNERPGGISAEPDAQPSVGSYTIRHDTPGGRNLLLPPWSTCFGGCCTTSPSKLENSLLPNKQRLEICKFRSELRPICTCPKKHSMDACVRETIVSCRFFLQFTMAPIKTKPM